MRCRPQITPLVDICSGPICTKNLDQRLDKPLLPGHGPAANAPPKHPLIPSSTLITQFSTPCAFEHSIFSVDGRPDLTLVVYNPAMPADADKLRTVLSHRSEADE